MLNVPQFSDFINNYSDFLLLSSFDKFKSFNLVTEKTIIYHSNIISQLAYATYLEKIDNLFFNSPYRLSNFKVKQIRSRTIDTTFGSITFKRRQYINKWNGKYFYYIDNEILNLVKYQRLSNELLSEIYYFVCSESYQKVANRFNLSKQTIYNKITALRPYFIDGIDYPDTPKKVSILYIQADEIHVPNQNQTVSKSSMIKTLTIHEGLKKVCKGRRKLINKIQLTKYNGESNDDFNERICETITKLYDYKTLYYYGDGANWIKSSANDLGATYIIDLFHSGQAINRFCTLANKEHIKPLQILLSNNLKNEFINYVEEKIGLENIYNNEFRTKSYRYIINNWKYIYRNYSLEKTVGCSQEGINYHSFASRLTTTPKGFNPQNAQVIAQLICAKNNGKNFRKLVHDKIIINKLYNYIDRNQNESYLANQGHISTQNKSSVFRGIINSTILN